MYRKSSPLLIDKLLRWNILKNKKYKRKASVFSEASESVKKRRILTTK